MQRSTTNKRAWRGGLLTAVLVLGGLLAPGGGAPAGARPVTTEIDSVSPSSVHWMDTVTITGSGFGDAVGRVYFGATESTMVYDWSDDAVTAAVPPGAPSARLAIAVQRADHPARAVGGHVDVAKYVLPKEGGRYAPGEIVVRLGIVDRADAVARAHGLGRLTRAYPDAEANSVLGRYFSATVEADKVTQRIQELAADPQVEWAEPVYEVRAALTTNDPQYTNGNQWAVDRIEAPMAWDHNTGGGADVAVIDSGVRSAHPDMGGKIISQRDYTGSGAADNCGHGTHVAGTVAAATNNGAGVAGIGWNTRVRSYKVLAWDNAVTVRACRGTSNHVVSAIDQANADNVRVLNLSLGGFRNTTGTPDACPAGMQTAIQNATNGGRLVVVAAGNDGMNTAPWPANCGAGAYPIGNTDMGDSLSADSNWGTWLALSAPGSAIMSTTYNGAPTCGGSVAMPDYAYCWGTSMAAPHVAGVAALLYSEGANRGEVDLALRRHVTPIACNRGPGNCGAGRLNAGRSVQAFALRSVVGIAGTPTGQGYWLFDNGARVNVFGDATWHRSMEGTTLAQPASAGDNRGNSGYWMFARDGGVFAFDAPFYGGMGGRALNCAIVGGKATPSGNGYWEVGCDGGIFNFGDAQFQGGMGGRALNCAVVGMAANPVVDPVTGKQGYWLVGCDGGVFAFGNAAFHGGTGGLALAAPISAIAPTPTGRGYWLVARDGGVFAFGDAPFLGNIVGHTDGSPIVGIEPHGAAGYWLISEAGSVYAFGDAPYLGNGL